MDRYVAHKVGDRWTVVDVNTDQVLRNWRSRRKNVGTVWWGTELEAIELAALMSKPVPSQLGDVSIVGDLDPPTRENAKQWAIYQNRNRRSTSAPTPSPFSQCPQCKQMVKEGHQCT
jgi:hypothetical protein